jgi:hypothetical protein
VLTLVAQLSENKSVTELVVSLLHWLAGQLLVEKLYQEYKFWFIILSI